VNKNFIFIILGVSLITYASIQIASNNTIFFYTTSEAFQNIDTSQSERIKLGGFVVSDSISKTSNAETSFMITDGTKDTIIIFDGFIPELFQEEMGVILDGYFQEEVFYSDDMLVKHDNEYTSENGKTYDVENYAK
jgi:cytochrome c-type biogenesis protein CcmE